ncbi:MAG: Crp/Fnr family transcriptional regulator [Bacteroidales bacterium]
MKYPLLSRSQLFAGLNDSEIESLLGSVNYRVRFFPAGAVAALAGEDISSVMIVLSGSMKGEMTDLAGRTIKIEDVNPPQALASAFIYGSGAHYPVNVIANIDSELLIIGKGEYLNLMLSDRRILLNYLTVVCTKALFLSARLRFLSFHTIKGKLAHYLSSLPGASSGRVQTDRTQQALSEFFGVTRPSLARVLGEMEKEGLISVERREVRLLDPRGLSRLSEL